MQVIKVKKYGLGQVQATSTSGISCRVRYDSSLNYEQNMVTAAQALCIKLNLLGFNLNFASDNAGIYYFIPTSKRNPWNKVAAHIEFDVTAKEWFDKVNGNSYFSARITDPKTGKIIACLPYQYGYGNQYEFEAFKTLVSLGLIPSDTDDREFWLYINHAEKITDCKKREVVDFGKGE